MSIYTNPKCEQFVSVLFLNTSHDATVISPLFVRSPQNQCLTGLTFFYPRLLEFASCFWSRIQRGTRRNRGNRSTLEPKYTRRTGKSIEFRSSADFHSARSTFQRAHASSFTAVDLLPNLSHTISPFLSIPSFATRFWILLCLRRPFTHTTSYINHFTLLYIPMLCFYSYLSLAPLSLLSTIISSSQCQSEIVMP